MAKTSRKQTVRNHGYYTWPCGGRKYALFAIGNSNGLGVFASQSAAFDFAMKLPARATTEL
jgi:hypothetical protein